MSLDIYIAEDSGGINITHNLTGLWRALGIYNHLYMMEGSKASEIVESLRDALAKAEADPEHYKQYDSPNGWGVLEHGMNFLREVIAECEAYPDNTIGVSK